jgi:TP901 family phage tail tape measure protein
VASVAEESVTIAIKVDDLATPEIKRVRRETKELGEAFEKTGKQTGKARDEQGRFIKGAGQGTDTVSALKHAMLTVGFDRIADAAQAAAAALVRYATQGVMAAVRANAELEQSIQDAVAISGGSYEDLEKAAVDAGMAAAFSAKQAGDALGFLAQAGFSATDATQALPGVLDLASAGSLDLARAADIASNALSGFGLGVDELGRVNDVLAKTAASSNTNVEQLGQALKQVAPLAVASSQSLESVSAAIGILGNAGIQATQGGTMLRGAIAALQKPSNEAAGVIESLSVKVNDAEGQMRPLIDVLGDLGKAGATNADLITIFGRETIAGVSALSQATGKWSVAIKEAETNSAGFAKEVAALKLETLAGQYQILTGSVETYAARLGQTLNPGLKEAALATNAVLAESRALDETFDRLSASVVANKAAFNASASSPRARATSPAMPRCSTIER